MLWTWVYTMLLELHLMSNLIMLSFLQAVPMVFAQDGVPRTGYGITLF